MVQKPFWTKMVLIYITVILVGCLLAYGGTNAVTVLVEHSSIPTRKCIAIDAGHGGIDGGAVSISGISESQINLEIAERLNDLLHLVGYQTYMLRTSDTSLHTEGNTINAQKNSDLKHRVQIVSEQNACLLISIHQNTYSNKKYSGAQVFYHQDEVSVSLAASLQDNFIKTLNPGSKRKPKVAKGIYLMENITCPGLLVECGFLTNIQEEAQLKSADYQKQICGVIAATVSLALH